jgi:general secretion pathway protein E
MEILERNLRKTSGIIIMTWPTGSWKTTTLYTILRKLNDWTKKIITLEDPIEYKIEGLQQSQINYDKGYDYESGLKAILRQDPDIILVWETRTKERIINKKDESFNKDWLYVRRTKECVSW